MVHHTPEKPQGGKMNSHDTKKDIHSREHEKHVHEKQCDKMERHSGTGHSIKEVPKKGGAGGKGTWGTWKDDVEGPVEEEES